MTEETSDVVVIGAGMSGIACARMLADAGRGVIVLDKGRGLGGRMATRRTDHGPLDHGAPWLEATSEPFAAAIAAMEEAGCAAPWTAPDGRALHVGLPGMSGALRAMADGLDRRSSHEVRQVTRRDDGWRLVVEAPGGMATLDAGTLVSTVPVVQAIRLLGDEPGVAAALEPVVMSPAWTLIAAWDEPRPIPAMRHEGSVAWLSDEGRKPGREPGGLVMHAAPDWSRERLELDRDEAAGELLRLLSSVGGPTAAPAHAAAHRWRYAQAETPLGQPFLAVPGLTIGGDWCLGPRVEDAFTSGTAIAGALLAAHARA